jgi:hypothetical protein
MRVRMYFMVRVLIWDVELEYEFMVSPQLKLSPPPGLRGGSGGAGTV